MKERVYKIGNSTITIKFGNIITSNADVIVSSDDTHMSMSGGVSECILKAGGDIVQEDAQKKLPALLGDVIVSTAGQLPKQKYIFHCMTIDYECDEAFYQKILSGKTTINEHIVRQCVKECFSLMQALNLNSIAFPLIGTGAAQLNMDMTAEIMSKTMADCLSQTRPYRIELYLFDKYAEKTELEYLHIFECFYAQEKLKAKEKDDKEKTEENDSYKKQNDSKICPVFISFASEDWEMVQEYVLQVLEREGISCFAYKKMNYYGEDYVEKITKAIVDAKVLVFASTKNSINSKEVKKELEFSDKHGTKIIPFKLDNAPYSDVLDYKLGTIHYIDLINTPNATQELVKKVKSEINKEERLE